MDIDAVVNSQDWEACPVPPFSSRAALHAALHAIVTADSEREAAQAATALQDAVGNDHAGALYPVAAPAVTVLLAVADRWHDQVRDQALTSLEEILRFEVLPEYRVYTIDDHEIDVEWSSRERFRDGLPILEGIASDKQPWQQNRRIALSILRLLKPGQ